VTYNGLSHDLESTVPYEIGDEDVRRIAAEDRGVAPGTFDNFIVDRFDTPSGGKRLFLRPKVPFGSDALELKARTTRVEAKDAALKAVGASAELTSLLLDIHSDPDALAFGASKALTEKFLELNEAIQEVQGHAAALALLDAVRGA
jgi:hypothetical protein